MCAMFVLNVICNRGIAAVAVYMRHAPAARDPKEGAAAAAVASPVGLWVMQGRGHKLCAEDVWCSRSWAQVVLLTRE